VSMDVVDKTPRLGRALFAAIYGRACLIIGVSSLSLTIDITLISLELEPCKYNYEVCKGNLLGGMHNLLGDKGKFVRST
jgi:hypothetical protein